MKLEEAITALVSDLKRYAESGKASPKAIAFRESVINTIIHTLNEQEAELERLRMLVRDRAMANHNDLRHRDDIIASLHGRQELGWSWSYLEGRLQHEIAHKRTWIDQETGRSLSPEAVRREKDLLRLVEQEFDMMYDAQCATQLALARSEYRYSALLGWAMMHGVDLVTWLHIDPDHYAFLAVDVASRVQRTAHGLRARGPWPDAVRIALDRRIVDGLVDHHGTPTGRAYRNAGAVAMSILTAVANDHSFRSALAQAGIELPLNYRPAWEWPPALAQATRLYDGVPES